MLDARAHPFNLFRMRSTFLFLLALGLGSSAYGQATSAGTRPGTRPDTRVGLGIALG